MQIVERPDSGEALKLLTAAGLPVADLTPTHFDSFFGCRDAGALVGVVGVEIHGVVGLLRSLVVVAAARSRGCGRALVTQAERFALSRGVRDLYLLTNTAAPFFATLGYQTVDRARAPGAIATTREFAVLCPTSSAFMVKRL